MAKKEHNPEKFLDRLHKLQSEQTDGIEYSLVRYNGEDADGEPNWVGDGAEADYRNNAPGRYGIWRDDGEGGGIIKETTIVDDGERALARRTGGRKRDGEEMSAAAIARAISGLHEGFSGLATQARAASESYEKKYIEKLQENYELKAENLQLQLALESKDEIPEGILRLLDRGIGIFTGTKMRKLFAERFGSMQQKLVDAIGYEATMRVAAIAAEEFGKNPSGLLTADDDESED